MNRLKQKTVKKYGKLLCATFLLSLSAISMNAQDNSVEKIIHQKDSIFWNAYNNCDIREMNKYLATDIEFYHDKGGATYGLENLNEGLKNGLCSAGVNSIKREAITESIHIFPLKKNEEVYGAIISGEHLFISNKTHKAESIAKFNHLWLLKEGNWKMHRVLSYDHQPAPFKNTKTEVSLDPSELKRLEGSYKMPTGDLITVKWVENGLELNAMGKGFKLYPENQFSFFTKDRDLTFSFSENTPRELHILEAGKTVAQATITQ